MIWIGAVVLTIVLIMGVLSPMIVERKRWNEARDRRPKGWE